MRAQPDRVEPKLPSVNTHPIDRVADVEKELDAFIKGVNDTAAPAKAPREQAEFVALTKHAVTAMIASHENAVTEAQNKLEEAKLYGDKLLAEIDRRENELAEMTARSKQFASESFDVCKRFEERKI